MTSLALDRVTKRFGGVTVMTDVSMTIGPGAITGLIGPNGAGKSTVVNLITGMLSVTEGTIRLDGRDITRNSPQAIARGGISRTFQNIRLLRDASVLDNVVIGFHRHETTSLVANLLGAPSVWREKRAFHEQAHAMLAQFGMTAYAAVAAGGLSYGHQRRVEMMRALAMSPSILLLDEPVAGMNDVEAADLGAIFRSLAQQGLGILLIEHNMRFVMNLCDTVHVLAFGRLIASGSADEVCRQPAVIDAYLGA